VKTLWIDASNGAAGDMLLAALLDAGADADLVAAGLRGLDVEPITLTRRAVRRNGLRAVHVTVAAPVTGTARGLAEVLAVLGRAPLPAPAAAFAADVFRRLAAAEAAVHGVPVEAVHFHEVGALDAIADVTGCALALHSLGLLGAGVGRTVGAVAVGSGTATTAHGRLPVPVPAVLRLLTTAGAPIAAHPAPMELCTPTGAAILTAAATHWGPPPAARLTATGVGAGTADPASHPNIVRVVLGVAEEPPRWVTTPLVRLDATVDDLDPRLWPDVLERLREAGAADAWCTPALARKGRPAQVLSVLGRPDLADLLSRVVFEQTTTLGLRLSPVERRSLLRDEVLLDLDGAPVRVKRGLLGGTPVTVTPEYDDVAAAARQHGRPVRAVMDEARRRAFAEPRRACDGSRPAFAESRRASDGSRPVFEEAGSAFDESRPGFDEAGPAFDEARRPFGAARFGGEEVDEPADSR
jgi:uncharacterized protein (TIGR00299 family) protein